MSLIFRWVLGGAMLGLVCWSSADAAGWRARPNILVVMTDD